MGKRKKVVLLFLMTCMSVAVLFFASCGGGSSSGSSNTGPATGVYRGQSAAGNNVLGLVFSDGRYYFMYSPPATPSLISLINSGSGASSNGTFASNNLLSVPLSFSAYTSGIIANGTFSAGYTSSSSLNGTFNYLPSGGSTITTTYDPTSATAATLTQVAKTYNGTFSFYYPSGTNLYTWTPTTTFTVSSTGSISGTVACWMVPVCTSAPCPTATCNVTGTLTPRTDVDAYDISLSIGSTTGGSTPLDGSYSGAAYYDAGTGNLNIAGISSTTNHAIGFR